MEQAYLAAEWPYPEMQARHFFLRGRFLRQRELEAISNTKSFPFWACIQIKHFLDNLANRDNFGKNPTVLESLCTGPFPKNHLISVLYAAVFGESYASQRSELAYWETVLDREIEDSSWDRVHLYIHKGSLNVHTQENG